MSVTHHIISKKKSVTAIHNGKKVLVAAFPAYCNAGDPQRWEEHVRYGDDWYRDLWRNICLRWAVADRLVEKHGFKPDYFVLHEPGDGSTVFEWKGQTTIDDHCDMKPVGVLKKIGLKQFMVQDLEVLVKGLNFTASN